MRCHFTPTRIVIIRGNSKYRRGGGKRGEEERRSPYIFLVGMQNSEITVGNSFPDCQKAKHMTQQFYSQAYTQKEIKLGTSQQSKSGTTQMSIDSQTYKQNMVYT